LIARDDGTRNGNLGFSCREAAETTGLSVRTCWRCFGELQALGFIRCTEKGGFSRKVLHSTTWRYTWAAWPGGSPSAPTRDFEKWRPEEKTRLQVLSEPVADFVEQPETATSPDAETTTMETGNPLVSAKLISSKTTTLTSYQGIGAADPETGQRK